MKTEQNKFLNKSIERAAKGNEKALHYLYQLYSKAMFNICMRMMNSREDAEDVLQEAFTDAFRNLSSFNNESTFGAWLKRIVVNRCINQFKKRQIEFVYTETETEPVHEEDVDFKHMQFKVDRVNKAIMSLPDGYRLVCSLYLLEGYDHKEIGEILSISESTSKSQYMRGKKLIRKLLSEDNTRISIYKTESFTNN